MVFVQLWQPSLCIQTVPFEWILKLACGLCFLKGAPFEPLEEPSLEDLTTMSIFHFVLAGGLPSAVVDLHGSLAKNQVSTGSSIE